MKVLRLAVRVILVNFILFTALSAGGLGILYFKGFFTFPDFNKLNDTRQASRMFDRNGEALRAYCSFCREILPLEAMGDLPKYAVEVEDHRYWKFTRRWWPFDSIGIVKAIFINITSGRVKAGASSITQQVTRNALLEDELRVQYESNSEAAKWWRKGREAWIAPIVQYKYARSEILKFYLNSNFCGYGLYGVSLCSWYWFDKKTGELNPAEKAWLFLLWRSPSYALLENKENAKKARTRVLSQFVERRLITESEQKKWDAYPLPEARPAHTKNPAPNFTEWLRRNITAKGKLVDMGLTIRTTLDANLQRTTQEALQKQLAIMRGKNPELTDLRACAVIIHRSSGAILVWAEEPSFAENEFLLCSQANPQTGSAMKPLFYALWLKKGGRLSCLDEGTGPCRLDDSSGITISMGGGRAQRIHNFPYGGKLARYVGIAEPLLCLTQSRNACTMSGVDGTWYSNAQRFHITEEDGKVRTERISKDEMLEFARDIGISLEIYKGNLEEARKLGMLIRPALADKLNISRATVDPGLTLPIGSINVSPLEMARMFAALTTGFTVEPYGIEIIQDASGRIIEPEHALPKIIFPKKITNEVTMNGKVVPLVEEIVDDKLPLGILRGLRATIELPHGTGQRAKRELNFQVCGKTGTATRNTRDPITGEAKGETTDNWFVGCTPSYVMAIWIGRDKKQPLMKPEWEGRTSGQFTGGSTALPIFIEVMRKLYETEPIEKFPEATNPAKPFFYPAPAETDTPENDAEQPQEETNNF
ncbi:penicillin-binding protein [Candidatus Giovannonibacteria bacterium]|nr:penicillin-binding protein [Candidatus Giovannonibacteria bacterium]